MNIEITSSQYAELTDTISWRIADLQQSLRDKEVLIERLQRDRHRFLERELIRRDMLKENINKMYSLAATLYNQGK